MTRLYLYDDAQARKFEPFALTRPVSELRAGAEIVRARWEMASGLTASGFFGAEHLDNFDEPGAPGSARSEGTVPTGSMIVNSRCVVALDAIIDDASVAYSCRGIVCAVRAAPGLATDELSAGTLSLHSLTDDTPATEISGQWLDEVWELVGDLEAQLIVDIPVMASRLSVEVAEHATVMGTHGVYCETGARVDPFVVLDASAGPILIRRGATVSSFSHIVGPCYIGEDSTVVGDVIRGCSIGNVCKVRGEMSGSVMLGHSNKGHTGFVGSSYLGRWVNFGSGTTTSNLKNTYGSVQLSTSSGMRDTGLQFLGSLVGDHAKTGIGTMLTTGCVVGAGANIYGAGSSPKVVPPFAWGASEPHDRYEIAKFVEVAARMMARRHATLSDKGRLQLEDSFQESERSR
ncbi:MAG: putative sugar nucleotidyl transferase [Gemmatimonadaceae bacterium]